MPQIADEGTLVLDTKLHCCPSCHAKVVKAVSGEPGVESFSVDKSSGKVTVKAPKQDPQKLFQTLQKKSGGKITSLLAPKLPKKEPKEVTVELKINLDCSSCIRKVEKAAWKLKDVNSVKVENHQKLIVRGWDLDPQKVCKEISKKTKKHAEIVPPKKDDRTVVVAAKEEKAKPEKKETHQQVVTHYVYSYPPQYFSDENPNACVLM